MISHKYKFIFIHIPKTGGNSIQSILKKYSEDEITVNKNQCGVSQFGVQNNEFHTIKHSSAEDYYNALGEKRFNEYFKFTCLRNPFDRAVSMYFSPHEGKKLWDETAFINLISKNYNKKKSQYDMIKVNNKLAIDYVIRFENIQKDFNTICKKLGIAQQKLPKLNTSQHKHYSKYYNKNLKILIKKIYQKDFEAFNYKFKNLNFISNAIDEFKYKRNQSNSAKDIIHNLPIKPKDEPEDIRLLKLTKGGMFANINNVIDATYRATKENFKFFIDWDESCYKDSLIEGDPWNYYFHNCFNIPKKYKTNDLKTYKRVGPEPENNIVRPKIESYLLLPPDRYLARHYIEKYIKLKPQLKDIINNFKDANFKQYIIGLHLRGPGRLHGGMEQYKKQLKLKQDEVPFDLYFNHVNEQLKQNPDAKIFLCSDSKIVVDKCREKYGDRIITYEATRSEYGEMHNCIDQDAKDANKGLTFPSYKLGEDVIVEAYLLSATNYLIHGNSNVTNFVLCNNPDLRHKYVFENIKINYLFAKIHDRLSRKKLKRSFLRFKIRSKRYLKSINIVHNN